MPPPGGRTRRRSRRARGRRWSGRAFVFVGASFAFCLKEGTRDEMTSDLWGLRRTQEEIEEGRANASFSRRRPLSSPPGRPAASLLEMPRAVPHKPLDPVEARKVSQLCAKLLAGPTSKSAQTAAVKLSKQLATCPAAAAEIRRAGGVRRLQARPPKPRAPRANVFSRHVTCHGALSPADRALSDHSTTSASRRRWRCSARMVMASSPSSACATRRRPRSG